jgi:hypothetical protein
MTNIDINSPKFLTRETLAAIVFAAAGSYWIYCNNLFTGLFGLLLGVSLGFMYKGISFDLPGKRYRIYTGLFQFRFGTWEILPSITGVTIKYFSEIITSGKPGRMRDDKIGHYILMLSRSNSSQGIILQRFSLDEEGYAIMLGQKISEVFQVPLATYL